VNNKKWAKDIHPAPFLKKKWTIHKSPPNHLKTKPDSRIAINPREPNAKVSQLCHFGNHHQQPEERELESQS
jgi:hypothetical protein